MVMTKGGRLASALLVGTILGGGPLLAQPAPDPATPPPAAATPPPAASGTVRTVNVIGAQRLEADTVRSYIKLRPGTPYDREAIDQAIKDLYATELFADVVIRDKGNGDFDVQVRENPVINRIVLEGNKRIKEDKIRPEIKLAPREIFTRSKARADVARIIELYRRQGRYAATVDPKMVQLDQNRVDLVFEIHEGDKSKVRRINIIGNKKFSGKVLREQMATKEAGITKLFSSGTSYDPDRLSYDQQKLRQFYLTNGYADFRVVSAVAELTPDKKDFIITYVVEEGDRYKFGNVDVDSQIRDLKSATLKQIVPMKKGDWYNAKAVEDTIDAMNELAGGLGYTPDVKPDFQRDKDTRTMAVTFDVEQAPRVYVERVDINGNTITRDKVVRREMRLAEGDAFNNYKVKRSRDRIQSLGFFQDKFEIQQKPGSAPDRTILEANVEEKATGQLQVSLGYSSLEKFIVDLSITQSNFMGKGQEVRAGASYSTYSKSVNVGFTEPYLFDKSIALGVDAYRRDYNSFNFNSDGDRNTTYSQTTTGFQARLGVPLTEYLSLATRYTLNYDQVTLDRSTYYADLNGDGTEECNFYVAGHYLCDALGNRVTSSVGYSLAYSTLNNGIHPTRGNRVILNQDYAGVGGDVKYLRTRIEGDKYHDLGHGFVLNLGAEGGFIFGTGSSRGPNDDKVYLTDRFQLGEPQFRGFDIRGVGPRVVRQTFNYTTAQLDSSTKTDEAIGGRLYYLGHIELEIPLGAGAKELGLRPSIFADVGSLWRVAPPNLVRLSDFLRYPDQPAGELNPYDPKVFAIRDSSGNPLYTVASLLPDGTTAAPNANTVTTCAIGYKPSATQPCTGTSVNGPLNNTIQPFQEDYLGNSPRPRVSVGIGVNWNSPFGPFRINIAKALLKVKGDDTKLFSFNVGTQF